MIKRRKKKEMTAMNDVSYVACKAFIRNINWFLQRNQQYEEAGFDSFVARNGTKYDAFKAVVTAMAYEKTNLMVVKYFEYILANLTRGANPLKLEPFEEKFLRDKDNLEILYDNEALQAVKLELLKDKLVDMEVDSIAEKVKKLKITSKIVIDSLTGLEDDIEDWFEKFEIKADAVDWTDDVKGVRLPAYLTDLTLVVWKTQTPEARLDYALSKKHILKELLDDTTLEQKFYSRKQ